MGQGEAIAAKRRISEARLSRVQNVSVVRRGDIFVLSIGMLEGTSEVEKAAVRSLAEETQVEIYLCRSAGFVR